MDIAILKKLRAQTGCSIMACKKALDQSDGDIKKAKAYLAKGAKLVVKTKAGRKAVEGRIASYVHSTKRIGSLVELRCETDFVARTLKFEQLASELALHIAGMAPKTTEELLRQPYVRDPSRSIAEFIAQVAGNVGEKIEVARFIRYEL